MYRQQAFRAGVVDIVGLAAASRLVVVARIQLQVVVSLVRVSTARVVVGFRRSNVSFSLS